MNGFAYHVLLCTQQTVEDKPHCRDQGSRVLLDRLRTLLRRRGLEGKVLVTPCGCLGLCSRGPNLLVYPGGTWYCRVTVDDLEELVSSHFEAGRPLQRLIAPDPGARHEEILAEMNRTLSRRRAEGEGVLPESMRCLASDFWASRVFLSAVELDAFSAVGDGCDAATAAEAMGTDPRATALLLDALVCLGLLGKSDGIYQNSPDAARFLRAGRPDDARAALMNRVNMWDRWSALSECVREGSAVVPQQNGPFATAAYVAATHRIAAAAAPDLVASLGLERLERVLDVGAGSGAYSVALLRAFPVARAELFDLPSVTHHAARYVREAGMEQRITLRPGDFNVDPLGHGFDLVLLSYVMHLGGPEANRRLLARAFDALEPGGRVVINDYVLREDRTLPRTAVLYALNMLVSSREGTVFALGDYHQMLESVGFSGVEKIALLGPTDLVTARKPGALPAG